MRNELHLLGRRDIQMPRACLDLWAEASADCSLYGGDGVQHPKFHLHITSIALAAI